jgi:stress-induced morphogen
MNDIKTEYMVQKAIDKALENQLAEKLYTLSLKVVDSKLSDQKTRDKITKLVINALEQNSENKIFGFALKSLKTMVSEKMAEIIDVSITELLKDLKSETSSDTISAQKKRSPRICEATENLR